MSKDTNEPNGSPSGLDRRAMIRTAIVAGGVAALGGVATAKPQEIEAAIVAEREWARALARQVAGQLPEAARQIPSLCLTSDQLEELTRVFENTLVTNMGCALPTAPRA